MGKVKAWAQDSAEEYLDSLESILYSRTGYHDLEQIKDMEEDY